MTSRPHRSRLITPSFSTDQAQAGSDSPSVSTPIPFSTTNPASLLWAHKLQAELGLLFHRMKEVESKQDAYDARIKATEAAAASLNETRADIVRLKRTKSAIDHGDAETRKWIEMIQVHIQRLDEEIKGDRRRQRNNTVELEQQNDELKGQVSTLGLALKELKETRVHQNKRPSEVSNSNEFRALAQRLDALESQRTQQEKVLRNQVSNLEKAYHASEARYKELEARMNAMVVSPDYPLPTSETTVHHLQPPTSGYVQVPASQEQEPALGQLDNRNQVGVSEQIAAYVSRSRKKPIASRPVQPIAKPKAAAQPTRPNVQPLGKPKAATQCARPDVQQQTAQVVLTQTGGKSVNEVQTQTQTPDLDAPYRARRFQKRPARGPSYCGPRLRSQNKPTLIAKLKLPKRDGPLDQAPAQSRHPARPPTSVRQQRPRVNQHTSKKTAPKRKAAPLRDIPQLVDDEAFRNARPY